MLEWLTGSRKRHTLPVYSRLQAVPSRQLPPDLALEEGSQAFYARRHAIEQDLLTQSRRPPEDKPVFTELMSSDSGGVVIFPLPDGGHCLPVFTTPFRAADYVRTLLTTMASIQYLSSSARQLLVMIRDLEHSGPKSLALDRCPRCHVVTAVKIHSVKSADHLLELWALHKATELARLSLYVDYAMKSARAGKLTVARDIALETVGHVSIEDPHPHLLLGKIAVALGDATLLREAKAFLLYFKHESWGRELDAITRTGSPNFEALD